jgi:hypothetical protein
MQEPAYSARIIILDSYQSRANIAGACTQTWGREDVNDPSKEFIDLCCAPGSNWGSAPQVVANVRGLRHRDAGVCGDLEQRIPSNMQRNGNLALRQSSKRRRL